MKGDDTIKVIQLNRFHQMVGCKQYLLPSFGGSSGKL